jgi:peroxiredoxin
MALTASNMVNLGVIAPDFTLLNTISNSDCNLHELKGTEATVIMFICNHCPYVVHVMPEIRRICDFYQNQGVNFIAISSNDVKAYPADAPELMPAFMERFGLSIPYLYDETQEVAKAYDAACTPDFFVFDAQLKLAYRGRLDESRPREENPKPLNGKDLRGALNALLSKQMQSEIQFPSMGCNIKWK